MSRRNGNGSVEGYKRPVLSDMPWQSSINVYSVGLGCRVNGEASEAAEARE